MNKLIYLMLTGLSLILAACNDKTIDNGFDGYVEAIQFYIASPQAGWIVEQNVKEGSQVSVGDVVCEIDDDAQRYAMTQAKAEFAASSQDAENLKHGAREEEIAVSRKLLDARKARLEEARLAFERQRDLVAKKLTSRAGYDQALAAYQVAQAELEQTQQQLRVLELPARKHQIAAAEQRALAARQELALQQWTLGQRVISARNNGTVETIYYRQGEYVNPGVPILSLIADDSLKVRFYVPERRLSQLRPGQKVKVRNDTGTEVLAHISFIAKDPEYAPPVLYSNSARESLVFLVEAKLELGSSLRIGQPVDIHL